MQMTIHEFPQQFPHLYIPTHLESKIYGGVKFYVIHNYHIQTTLRSDLLNKENYYTAEKWFLMNELFHEIKINGYEKYLLQFEENKQGCQLIISCYVLSDKKPKG